MTLSQAIINVEQAEVALQSADNAQTAATAKFNDAQLAKAAADQSDADAASAYISSLEELIVTAQAAKLARLG